MFHLQHSGDGVDFHIFIPSMFFSHYFAFLVYISSWRVTVTTDKVKSINCLYQEFPKSYNDKFEKQYNYNYH